MSGQEAIDYIVVGAGIAGLRAAIELAQAGRVLVLTKEKVGESNTEYAQGGIAVALGGDEDVSLHLEDTVQAGDGLVNPAAAEVLVQEGPRRVEELLAWGANFDRDQGRLMMTKEGAHSRSRILHANGDATGREIGRALLARARCSPEITIREHALTLDLLVEDGVVRGVSMCDPERGVVDISARAVLLATGGAGQIYSDTTNPLVATGDGIAMAWRAGAEIADMEFYQFHPTALSLAGAPRFLLSEALRGEGAYLRNWRMERFMERYHPSLELAPRDVVARAIVHEESAGGAASGETQRLPVYLDMRHVTAIDLGQRFPGISAFLQRWGLALAHDPIPVRPAAHYLMGGIRVEIDGRSSLPRLYAAGEAACAGVHGANRLASNSLLEGLVFGARSARTMLEERSSPSASPRAGQRRSAHEPRELEGLGARLKKLMWSKAGLLRDGEGLSAAAAELEGMRGELPESLDRPSVELSNLHAVAMLTVRSALARRESRGAHFRNDFPRRNDVRFRMHSIVRGNEICFADFSSLPLDLRAEEKQAPR